MIAVLGLLMACSSPEGQAIEGAGAEETEAQGIVLRVFLENVKPGGGTLVVQAEYDPSGEVTLPDPSAQGLEFEQDGPPIIEQVGDRNVLTQRWIFRGPAGSYEIVPLEATWTPERKDPGAAPAPQPPEPGGEPAPDPDAPVVAKSRSVFVDIETPPPREGELVDIVEPPVVWRPPWLLIGLVGALFAGGLLLAFRPRRAREAPAAIPDPPDVVALTAWEAVRRSPDLTIDDKAREVARIFREYVEAVLGFEASSRTTSELVAHLQSLKHLPEGNVPRARRVLRAADRVKFAEDRPREDIEGWLGELDADLRAFVESTRPSAWRAEKSR